MMAHPGHRVDAVPHGSAAPLPLIPDPNEVLRVKGFAKWTAHNHRDLMYPRDAHLGTTRPKRHAGGFLWETKIGGSASARVGFWGATPVVRPSGADQAAVTLGNTDGEIGGLTISEPPTQAEVQAMRDACEELADDVRALATLAHALRGALVAVGVVKGGA